MQLWQPLKNLLETSRLAESRLMLQEDCIVKWVVHSTQRLRVNRQTRKTRHGGTVRAQRPQWLSVPYQTRKPLYVARLSTGQSITWLGKHWISYMKNRGQGQYQETHSETLNLQDHWSTLSRHLIDLGLTSYRSLRWGREVWQRMNPRRRTLICSRQTCQSRAHFETSIFQSVQENTWPGTLRRVIAIALLWIVTVISKRKVSRRVTSESIRLIVENTCGESKVCTIRFSPATHDFSSRRHFNSPTKVC